MKKRLFGLLFMLAVLCAVLCVSVSATTVASGTCGDNLTWTLDDEGLLTISGTGEMWDELNTNLDQWGGEIDPIKQVCIESGVTTVGEFAFQGCSNLTTVKMADSVTEIGWRAFGECPQLSELTLSESLTLIGDLAFERCVSLTDVNLPPELEYIGSGAFAGCSSLEHISFPDILRQSGGCPKHSRYPDRRYCQSPGGARRGYAHR